MAVTLMLIIITIIVLVVVVSGQAANGQQQHLQCEMVDDTADTFLLNCTTKSNDAIRIGVDRHWNTIPPWISDEINPSIYQAISLRSCSIADMGDYAFKSLVSLRKIDLSQNRLTYLNEHVFDGIMLQHMTELDLSANQFDTMPVNALQKLNNLDTLKFNDNKVGGVVLKRQLFDNLKSLKHLELKNCNIRQLEADVFSQMPRLEYLSIANNYLANLNYDTFRDLGHMRYLYVHDNLLLCDCKLRWLIAYLKSIEMFTTVPHDLTLIKCQQPNSLRTNKLDFIDINPDSFMCDVKITNLTVLSDEDQDVDVDDSGGGSGAPSIRLSCQVYADPEPIVYWSFGNKHIDKALNEHQKYFITEKYINSKTNKISELKINNLQNTDFGLYTCTGEISGSINQQQIQLTANSDNFLTRSLILSSRTMSNWTIVLLIAIAISICIFTLSVILFVCWKCKKLKRRYQSSATDMMPNHDANKILFMDDLNLQYSLRDDVTPKYALASDYGRMVNSNQTKSDSFYYDDILQMSLCDGGVGVGGGIDTSDANLIPKSHMTPTTKEQMYATIRPKYMQYHSNSHDQMYVCNLNNNTRSYHVNHAQYADIPMGGSATSLDEEDLNDLKDFEDVTFDNLNKPAREQSN